MVSIKTKIKELEFQIYTALKIDDSKKRRLIITNEMNKLELDQIGCFNCDGHCCTKVSNSMKITPLEAFEMLQFLVTKDISLLKEKLINNVLEFRLDHEIYTGKKSNSAFRKTYTCPFYSPGSKGCSIQLEHKPYGCLAFNPKLINDNGSNCALNEEIFKQREVEFSADELNANEYLKKELALDWEKLEIPRALLSIMDKIEV